MSASFSGQITKVQAGPPPQLLVVHIFYFFLIDEQKVLFSW